jgi:endoglycosylceramidase
MALVATATACGGGGGGDDDAGDAVTLPRLHAVRGERPGVFDEDGRQVVLRGVNVNGLAEYARANPDLEPNRPVTDETWDLVAAEGFNAVRLLVSWSRLEPEPGEIDDAYVDEIVAQVRAAGERGVYTIVDMHQDAWGPHVATPPGVTCPPGREPANGWDGAPGWATPAAGPGLDSCRPAGGEAKPGSDLVVEAWDRFYLDTDGVQTHLVDVWEHLAAALADEPSVAGYDLLNEPGHGSGPGGTGPVGGLLSEIPALGDYYARAIDAIRRGEADAGADPRPIFFEHSVAGNPPPVDFSDDPGLVFAPHIYGGSIVELLTVDQNWDVMVSLAEGWETSIWVGEYGWWDDPAERPEIVERVERFAAREDGADADAADGDGFGFVPVGSAWWQWDNGCGDPHQITEAGAEPPDEIRQYRVTRCVDGVAEDAGVVPAWREVLTRPAARFVPGWITSVSSSPGDGTFSLAAEDAEPGGEVELWVPGDGEPTVGGTGIAAADPDRRGDGWTVTATVCTSVYEVVAGPGAPPAPPSCDQETT